MKSRDESLDVLRRALKVAGGDEADASFISVDQNITRFANSNVHQNMSEESAWLTLRIVADGAVGVASSSSFDDASLARTAELAREAARHAGTTQGFAGLYRGGDGQPALATWDEATAQLAPAAKAEALRDMFASGRAAGVDFAGVYSTGRTAAACANSHGIERYATATHSDATAIAIGPRGSGYATARSRRASDVSIAALGERAISRATLLADVHEELAPGTYDLIIEPAAIAEVFEWLGMIAFTGQSYEDGSSFLVGANGRKLFGENVTIADDATDESFLPFPFDLEGVAKRRVPIIERGVAHAPVVDKMYADRLNLPLTGNCWQLGSSEHGSAFHLSMDAGDSSLEEMIASTKLGIWVTRFNYVNGLLEPRTALMTGTTRDGTFLVRDGRVAARLPNLRWTQSMTEAFANVESLSRDRQIIGTWYNPFGGTIAPTIKVRDWHITGKQATGSPGPS
jgi:PmbA protein